MIILDLYSFWTSYRWPPEHPAPQILIHNLPNIFLLLFTSLTFAGWHIKYRFTHILLKVAQTKAKKDNVGEMMKSKKTKADKESTSKVYSCNIFGISFMFAKGVFDHVSNIHNNCTICNIQLNPVKSLNHKCFLKRHFELFKCKGCEKYFKTEDYLASHRTTVHNRCYICGEIF